MNLVPFIADSAADALDQIHAQLGPDAVVVSVRKLPAQGLARLWPRSGRIEVMATVPEMPAPVTVPESRLRPIDLAADARPRPELRTNRFEAPTSAPSRSNCAWRSIGLLETVGLLPLTTERLLDSLESLHGPTPPESLAEELSLTRTALTQFWRPPPLLEGEAGCGPHVFVGPCGAGKTTVLCKWLTQAVLLEGQSARVWRLDGATANTAESLSVYAEILGVRLERFWTGPTAPGDAGLQFIDLPGVDPQDHAALSGLRERLQSLPSPQVHLVLNAAYEVPTLFAQARAFTTLPVHDLIFTHLDEESRWAKLWNFVVGTNCCLRFLSGGKNIPGQFLAAAPELLLPPQFRHS